MRDIYDGIMHTPTYSHPHLNPTHPHIPIPLTLLHTPLITISLMVSHSVIQSLTPPYNSNQNVIFLLNIFCHMI